MAVDDRERDVCFLSWESLTVEGRSPVFSRRIWWLWRQWNGDLPPSVAGFDDFEDNETETSYLLSQDLMTKGDLLLSLAGFDDRERETSCLFSRESMTVKWSFPTFSRGSLWLWKVDLLPSIYRIFQPNAVFFYSIDPSNNVPHFLTANGAETSKHHGFRWSLRGSGADFTALGILCQRQPPGRSLSM